MKSLYITFEDKEFRILEKLKFKHREKWTWRTFLLHLAKKHE